MRARRRTKHETRGRPAAEVRAEGRAARRRAGGQIGIHLYDQCTIRELVIASTMSHVQHESFGCKRLAFVFNKCLIDTYTRNRFALLSRIRGYNPSSTATLRLTLTTSCGNLTDDSTSPACKLSAPDHTLSLYVALFPVALELGSSPAALLDACVDARRFARISCGSTRTRSQGRGCCTTCGRFAGHVPRACLPTFSAAPCHSNLHSLSDALLHRRRCRVCPHHRELWRQRLWSSQISSAAAAQCRLLSAWMRIVSGVVHRRSLVVAVQVPAPHGKLRADGRQRDGS